MISLLASIIFLYYRQNLHNRHLIYFVYFYSFIIKIGTTIIQYIILILEIVMKFFISYQECFKIDRILKFNINFIY